MQHDAPHTSVVLPAWALDELRRLSARGGQSVAEHLRAALRAYVASGSPPPSRSLRVPTRLSGLTLGERAALDALVQRYDRSLSSLAAAAVEAYLVKEKTSGNLVGDAHGSYEPDASPP